MNDLETLSHRLQTLENRLRRMRLLAVVGSIIVAALLLMGQAPFPRNTPAFRGG
jgi:hypothetical protein